jgi:hypothetical protein
MLRAKRHLWLGVTFTLATSACTASTSRIESCSFDPSLIDFGAVTVGTLAQERTVLRDPAECGGVIRSVRYDPIALNSAFSVKDLHGLPVSDSTAEGDFDIIVQFGPTESRDYSGGFVFELGHEVSLAIKASGRE